SSWCPPSSPFFPYTTLFRSCAFHRIDDAGHHHGEGQECPEFHAFGNGAGHNRHGGSHKDDLEEEIRCARVDRATLETVFTTGELAQHAVNIHIGNAGEEEAAVIHDGVAAHHVHGAGNGKQSYVPGQDFSGVFGAY